MKRILKNKSKVEDIVNIIQQQIKRGSHLISNVRKLSQLEESEIILQRINVLDFLEKAIVKIKKEFLERNINIFKESPNYEVIVEANDYLNDLFFNILINSIRHNENDVIYIKISPQFLYCIHEKEKIEE